MSALAVLRTPDLVQAIVIYQAGRCRDISKLCALLSDVDAYNAVSLHRDLAQFHAYFPSWQNLYPIDRIDRLVSGEDSEMLRVQLLAYALVYANISLLEFLASKYDLEIGPQYWELTATHGLVQVLQFFYDKEFPCFASDAMARAVDCGQLVVIDYLHEQKNVEIGSFALSVACANGNLRVAEYIYHHTTSPYVQTSTVAKRGHLHIIKFLHEHNIPEFTTETMDEAAIAGHLDIVKYLRTHRQEGCTTRAMTGAAENGHTDVVLFLRQYSYKYFFRSVFRSINSPNKLCVVQ